MLALDRSMRFKVPPQLEANEPPEARGLRRDEVRMLVSREGAESADARFTDLPNLLEAGDLIVANDSGTLPAEVTAQGSEDTLAFRLSTHLEGPLWTVEPREVRVTAGETLTLPAGGTASMLEPYLGSTRLWIARLDLPEPPVDYLLRWGRPIRYPYVDREWPIAMYQTVYHRALGSAEMPSAGRPFSQKVIDRLGERGIGFVTLTLHTGVSSLESHEAPYPEWYRIPEATAARVRETKAAGGRAIAVGTTVVRALESAAGDDGTVRAAEGWTDLMVTPERGVRVVDGLLTGFHEPESTHLAMLEAIAGPNRLEDAYQAALQGGYLWHEFGDVHLIVAPR